MCKLSRPTVREVSLFQCTIYYSRQRQSLGVGVLSQVCLSVFSHDVSHSDAVKVTEHDRNVPR